MVGKIQKSYNEATGQMKADLKIIGTKAKTIKGSPKLGAYETKGIRVSQGGKGRTKLGRVSKSYTSKKERGIADGTKITAFDEVTPAIMDIKYYLKGFVARQLATTLERLIVENVPARYYDENRGKWPVLSKRWLEYKSTRGYDTRKMHMHDTKPGKSKFGLPLATNVATFGSKLDVKQVGSNSYAISGLDEEFASSPYVWLHEQGFTNQYGKKIPARPFINPGINDSLAGALRVVFERNPTKRKSSAARGATPATMGGISPGPSPTSPAVTARMPAVATSTGGMTGGSYTWNTSSIDFVPRYKSEKSKMLPLGLMGILWWILPPVPLLNYLGYAHDLKGYMSGHFFQSDTATSFARGLLRGKASQMAGIPSTRKMMRRGSRMTIWGG